MPGFQHDVILSLGLAFRDWSRTPKERAQRPGSDSITPSPTQLLTARFGLAAGLTLPVEDYHTAGFAPGWLGTALVGFGIGRSPLGFRVDGHYSTNTSNQSRGGVLAEYKDEFFGADADLTFMDPAPRRVKPYMLFGSGVYRVTDTYTYIGYSSSIDRYSSTKFAWNLGAGFTAGVLFFEARYVHFGGGLAFVPITAGYRFGAW